MQKLMVMAAAAKQGSISWFNLAGLLLLASFAAV
jgi:hypothetical protein